MTKRELEEAIEGGLVNAVGTILLCLLLGVAGALAAAEIERRWTGE